MPDLRSTFNRLSEEVEPTVHRRSENGAPFLKERCTVGLRSKPSSRITDEKRIQFINNQYKTHIYEIKNLLILLFISIVATASAQLKGLLYV